MKTEFYCANSSNIPGGTGSGETELLNAEINTYSAYFSQFHQNEDKIIGI